jgi:hypothetical protein
MLMAISEYADSQIDVIGYSMGSPIARKVGKNKAIFLKYFKGNSRWTLCGHRRGFGPNTNPFGAFIHWGGRC